MTKPKSETNRIKKLSDYSHLRQRLNMYLGSDQPHSQEIVLYRDNQPYVSETTWVPALYTCLREIIDNSLDEINGHGEGNRIDVTFDPITLVMSVADNGRGIPFDYDEEHKQYLATMVLSEPRAGRNFGSRGEVAGVNGIGSAAVSNTSEWFRFEIVRDGKKFRQEFSEGPEDSTQLTIGKPKITPSKSHTGTKVEFRLSERVYQARNLPDEFVKSRITEIAIANPHIRISYNGEHIRVKPRAEHTLFPNRKPIIIEIDDDRLKSRFFIVSNGDQPEHIHSLVNNIPMFNGGVHIDIFRRHFYGNLLSALEKESKKRKLSPNRSDVQDGLFIYNITTMTAPNFDSQSKSRLINEEIALAVRKSLESDQLYRDLIKRNPDWINSIYERCAKRTMKKDAAELAKLNKANKRVKVEKLMDANGRDRSKCVLLLAEGDCLEENTQIVTIDHEGKHQDVAIRDIVEGDLVISHTNAFRVVERIAKKVAEVYEITTPQGIVKATGDHRMYCHDRRDNEMKWVRVSDLDTEYHRFIRNRIVDMTGLAPILENNVLEEKLIHNGVEYDRKIVFQHGDDLLYEISTDDHQYGVVDITEMQYRKIAARDINPAIHLFPLN